MALPTRLRKMLGMILLLAFIVVYAFSIMLIGVWALENANGWQKALYYAVTGCAWAFPAMLILKWMMKPDASAG